MVRIWSLSKSLVSKRKTHTKWLLKIVTLGFGTIFGQVSFIQSSKLFHKKPQTSLIIIYGIGDFWRSDHWSRILLCAYFWIWLVMQIILESAFIHRKTYFLEGRSIPAKRILDIFGRVIKSIKHHQCTHNDLLHLGSRRIFLRLLTLFK